MSTATPEAPEQFAEWLGSYSEVDKLAEAINDGTFAKQVGDYVRKAQEGATADLVEIRAAAEREAQKVLAGLVGAEGVKRLNLNPHTSPRGGVPGGKRAIGAGLNGMTDDLTDFMQTIWHKQTDSTKAEKLGKINAYLEKYPAEGGFLVPEEYRLEIMQVALERAVVRPRARVIAMNSAKLSFPAIDETSHASTVMGGVLAYRTEEAQALVESGAKFRKVTLDLTKQTLFSNVSNELIADTGGAIETFIRSSFGAAAAWFEDIDFMTGSGAGEPLGALSPQNTGIIAVTAQSGQGAATIVWQNIVDMYARLLPSSLGSAVWVIGPDVFPQLATMGLVVGTGGGPVWLPDGTGAPTMTLLGRPIVISEKVPGALGTQGDISLVDFSYYLIGDGMRARIESSTEYQFGTDQTSFRLIQRNDGRPWFKSPLTPANGSATLSPFVQLSSTRT